MSKTKPLITFIGAGNMTSSLIGGLVADEYPATQILATNPTEDKLIRLTECFNIKTTTNNREGAEKADIIVLAVKPMILKSVILEIKDVLQQKQPLIISVVTGIEAETIMKWADCPKLPIVRSMPNTPALLRCGTTGLYANHFVTELQKASAESILRAVGITIWFKKESDLDIVTAVSGSGPAYFFLMMEAMLESGIKMGLNAEQAQLLTVNTALGAARMALESGKDVKTLRTQVTSKGGTTEQAIKVFESGKLRDLFLKALSAARDRAVELARMVD